MTITPAVTYLKRFYRSFSPTSLLRSFVEASSKLYRRGLLVKCSGSLNSSRWATQSVTSSEYPQALRDKKAPKKTIYLVIPNRVRPWEVTATGVLVPLPILARLRRHSWILNRGVLWMTADVKRPSVSPLSNIALAIAPGATHGSVMAAYVEVSQPPQIYSKYAPSKDPRICPPLCIFTTRLASLYYRYFFS